MSYDITHCTYDGCALFGECRRALRDEIKREAAKAGVLNHLSCFLDRPDCYVATDAETAAGGVKQIFPSENMGLDKNVSRQR